ncbi:hypothetical protein BH10BDE1_BH10BDE1_23360 [soil metagenome]
MINHAETPFLNPPTKFKARVGLAIAFLVAWLFLYVAFEVTEDGTGDLLWVAFDHTVYNAIISMRLEALSSAMLSFTYIGSTIAVSFVALVALIYFYFRSLKSDFRILLGSSLGSLLLIRTSKWVFGRVRPSKETWLMQADGLSFPSGHSAGSFAVLGAVFYILGRSCEHPHQRWTIWGIGILLVLTIGVSRVYLGVHYPTDVLGGFLLGLAVLLFSISIDVLIASRGRHKETARPQ